MSVHVHAYYLIRAIFEILKIQNFWNSSSQFGHLHIYYILYNIVTMQCLFSLYIYVGFLENCPVCP